MNTDFRDHEIAIVAPDPADPVTHEITVEWKVRIAPTFASRGPALYLARYDAQKTRRDSILPQPSYLAQLDEPALRLLLAHQDRIIAAFASAQKEIAKLRHRTRSDPDSTLSTQF